MSKSDTETDWENVSSFSSSDNDSDLHLKTITASSSQNDSTSLEKNVIKPWNPDSINSLLSEKTPLDNHKENPAIFMETEESAIEYITALRSNEKFEINVYSYNIIFIIFLLFFCDLVVFTVFSSF